LNRNRYLYLILSLFAFAEIVINPIGEFPLNDDWAYSITVQNLVLNGRIESPNWEGAIFMPQLFWGALFSTIFGFSFTVLRFSEIVLGIVGIIILYLILGRITGSKTLTSFGTLLFALNPIYFQQTNTFQPDVPYAVISLVSFYFLLSFLDNPNWVKYVLGILFALLATLQKQTGISIGLAFGFCQLIFYKRNSRSILIAILPTIILASTVIIYKYIRAAVGGLPGAAYDISIPMFFDSILHPDTYVMKKVAYYFFTTSLSLGLFIFPLALPAALKILRRNKCSRFHIHIFAGTLLVYIVLIVLRIHFRGSYMPFAGNAIYDIGIGPIVMTGIDQNEIPEIPKAGGYFWCLLTAIGAAGFLGFIYLIYLSVKHYFSSAHNKGNYLIIASIFSVAILTIYIIPFLFVHANTKYLTSVLPFLFISVISSVEILEQKFRIRSSTRYRNLLLLYAPVMFFSVCATHDYLSWNRTRWNALNYLTETGNISLDEIDGGFEFNEWHFSHIYVWQMTNDDSKKGRFWYVGDDKYIIAFHVIRGYEIFKEFKYQKYIPFGMYPLYILRRSENAGLRENGQE
tara:strand:- start:1616 stop:3331 length:1716 start_codon:yes stop_codon:yes gene_type:complete